MPWNSKKGMQSEQSLGEWFTPSLPAVNNYVDRGTLDKKIFREFAQKGRQVLVYGPTGAGKTSMVLDNLARLNHQYQTKYVRVTMTNSTTTESFIADVANQLNLERDVQVTEPAENGESIKGEFGLRRLLKISGELQDKVSKQVTTEHYSGTDDFSILEDVLFRTNTVLIVDDMENLTDNAQSLRIRLAEIAKNMSDDAVNYSTSYAKIVFVGIAETAEQLWNDVQSLKSRLATIKVPYLNQDESNAILENGWHHSSLISSREQVERATYISSGIGKVVHEIGQKTGYAAIDDETLKIQDKHINTAISDILDVNELDYESILENAKNRNKTKTRVRNYVLYVMANSGEMSMTSQEVLQAVNKLRQDTNLKISSISPALSKLKSMDVLAQETRNKWHYSDPMFKAYVREHRAELLDTVNWSNEQ